MKIRDVLIVIHRWMGVTFCLLFLLWFLSGFVMMYWTFPEVTPADRITHSPVLDASTIRVSPQAAYAALEAKEAPSAVRLIMFDGRPAYRFAFGDDEFLVYADTGEIQNEFPPELTRRIAATWTRQPGSEAVAGMNTEEDQWTVSGQFRALRPMMKYSWPNGEQVYVSAVTGEVVQYTTRASRFGAYFGAIPHWFYFTSLRKHASAWAKFIIWASGLATFAALLGIVVGLSSFSPAKRFKYKGVPSTLPYTGQKRWHSILGLVFGFVACSWAFSGMLSMDPFPKLQHGKEVSGDLVETALRGAPMQMEAFNARLPQEALAPTRAGLQVKELELASFAGEPFYLATAAPNRTEIIPVHGEPHSSFDQAKIVAEINKAVHPDSVVESRLLTEYDAYYRDRHNQRPLPVFLVRLNDVAQSTYYIDPKTAELLQSYNSRSRWNRWLYHGLHSIDFPFLYKRRPAWDIVVVVLLVGGTSLCITSLILASGVLRRKIMPK